MVKIKTGYIAAWYRKVSNPYDEENHDEYSSLPDKYFEEWCGSMEFELGKVYKNTSRWHKRPFLVFNNIDDTTSYGWSNTSDGKQCVLKVEYIKGKKIERSKDDYEKGYHIWTNYWIEYRVNEIKILEVVKKHK